MASKEGAAGQAFGPVLAAVATMQGNVSRSEKTQAHEFLEKFQKSVCLTAPLPQSASQILTDARGIRTDILDTVRSKLGRSPTNSYNPPMLPWKQSYSRPPR